jgi:hypothetical protein
MKIIVAGGRDFNNYDMLQSEVLWFLIEEGFSVDSLDDIEFVLGGARGADNLGLKFANEYGFKYKMFIPDWQGLGKKAGIVRNHEMGDYADALIAFWNGESTGTRDMINYATKQGLRVVVVKYEVVELDETSIYCRRTQ